MNMQQMITARQSLSDYFKVDISIDSLAESKSAIVALSKTVDPSRVDHLNDKLQRVFRNERSVDTVLALTIALIGTTDVDESEGVDKDALRLAICTVLLAGNKVTK